MMRQDFLVFIIGALATIDGHAALGAAFGCCFFLAMPQDTTTGRRFLFTVSSYGLGYAAGVSVYGTDKQMLVSSIVAALIVALLIGVTGLIQNKTPELIELLLRLWRR